MTELEQQYFEQTDRNNFGQIDCKVMQNFKPGDELVRISDGREATFIRYVRSRKNRDFPQMIRIKFKWQNYEENWAESLFKKKVSA